MTSPSHTRLDPALEGDHPGPVPGTRNTCFYLSCFCHNMMPAVEPGTRSCRPHIGLSRVGGRNTDSATPKKQPGRQPGTFVSDARSYRQDRASCCPRGSGAEVGGSSSAVQTPVRFPPASPARLTELLILGSRFSLLLFFFLCVCFSLLFQSRPFSFLFFFPLHK